MPLKNYLIQVDLGFAMPKRENSSDSNSTAAFSAKIHFLHYFFLVTPGIALKSFAQLLGNRHLYVVSDLLIMLLKSDFAKEG